MKKRMRRMDGLLDKLPSPLADTVFLRMFGLMKIPLLGFVRPRIVEINEDSVEIEIPLSRRTKNHLGSMYFGALAIGADCAAGYLCVRHIITKQLPVTFVFKDMTARFIKRPDGNVRFFCSQGEEVLRSLTEAMKSGERINIPMVVTATVPSVSESEAVAEFTLTLSLKRKKGA